MRIVFYALLSFSAPPPAGGEVFLTITLSGVDRQKEERKTSKKIYECNGAGYKEDWCDTVRSYIPSKLCFIYIFGQANICSHHPRNALIAID